MIDIVEPDIFFTAGDFCRYVIISIEEIKKRDNIPFFVGGTGLYIDSFFKGIANIPEIDKGVREQLTEDLDLNGLSDLAPMVGWLGYINIKQPQLIIKSYW